MLRRWRTLFRVGVFLVPLALLAPAAQAQDDDVVSGVAVEPKTGTHDKLIVKWVFNHGKAASSTDVVLSDSSYDDLGFLVYYTEGKSAALLNTESDLAGAEEVDVDVPTDGTVSGDPELETSFTYELGGLDPATDYVVNVLHYNTPLKHAEVEDIPAADTAKTGNAPTPSDVRDVEVMSGDTKLMVSWRAPARPAGQSTTIKIDRYEVRWRESQTVDDLAGGWLMYPPDDEKKLTELKYEIPYLENDITYDVQVRAINDAKGKGNWAPGDEDGNEAERATPTAGGAVPALPIFGAVALGAGLLAAGRARLRRRQLHAGLVQQQITR